MHITVKNLLNINEKVKVKFNSNKNLLKQPEIIAVSKTFKMDHIMPVLNHGHVNFGENKVQEALEKWTLVKNENKKIKLHLIGKLQTNKVKSALKLFDYIHSLDSEKLANKISRIQKELNINRKLFIQVNIGNEIQKSGISINEVLDFHNYCKTLDLDIRGLMCIPPFQEDSKKYFIQIKKLNEKLKLKELSMGMSSDYLEAIENNATFIRVGSSIFGERS
tara:strand:+ start:415 stop:1077 length:663 start_codon:yes stop_codon:yes gene_type:complete